MPSLPAPGWNANALWQGLRGLLPQLSVEIVHTVDSTNSTLIDRLRSGAGRRQADAQAALLVAEVQTRGRGRMGREWLSQSARCRRAWS